MDKQFRSKNLFLFRVDSKESGEKVTKFLEKNPLDIPVLLDESGKVGRLFGVWAHPTTYLIDRHGLVRYRAIGTVDWAKTEPRQLIDQLLQEK